MTENREAIDLMLRAGRGDLEAFEALHRSFSRPILNYFFRLTWDRQLSEDMTQEVFVKLWKAAPRYRPTAKFTTFLFQIAKNHWLNELDRRKRRPGLLSLEAAPEGSPSPRENVAWIGRDPSVCAQDAELGERLREAVAGLSPKLRDVYILAEIRGLKYREIAEELDIPVGTVKSRMFHAERALRALLASHVES
jgi:RNA polymerase sigma-70 factor (ECF subfamily)